MGERDESTRSSVGVNRASLIPILRNHLVAGLCPVPIYHIPSYPSLGRAENLQADSKQTDRYPGLDINHVKVGLSFSQL